MLLQQPQAEQEKGYVSVSVIMIGAAPATFCSSSMTLLAESLASCYSWAESHHGQPGAVDLACSVQYSLWLDQHSMADVLKFIKGALNAAAAKMDQDEACKELVGMMTKICNQS